SRRLTSSRNDAGAPVSSLRRRPTGEDSQVGLRKMKKLAAAMALAVASGIAGAMAQSYPSRPVTVIVPFAAGGVTDIVARIVGGRRRTSLGQSLIVESGSGAGGTTGAPRLFRAAPDGYTVVVGQWTSHVGAGAMYPVPFDYVSDFEPVSLLSTAPLW